MCNQNNFIIIDSSKIISLYKDFIISYEKLEIILKTQDISGFSLEIAEVKKKQYHC